MANALLSLQEYEAIKSRNGIYRAQLKAAYEHYAHMISTVAHDKGVNGLSNNQFFNKFYSFHYDVCSCFDARGRLDEQMFTAVTVAFRNIAGEDSSFIPETHRFLAQNICYVEDRKIFFGGVFPDVPYDQIILLPKGKLSMLLFCRFIELFRLADVRGK